MQSSENFGYKLGYMVSLWSSTKAVRECQNERVTICVHVAETHWDAKKPPVEPAVLAF
jgi:hypothetical protein